MKLAFLFFGNQPDEKWQLCKQMGIEYAIAKLAPELTNLPSIDNFESFEKSKEIYQNQGFKLWGLEGDQFDMHRIKLGLKGRENDIEKYCKMLENMNRLDVRLLCYNFMATGWYRTNKNIKERGNATVSGFSMKEAQLEPQSPYGVFSENQIWDNYQWFIERVMPVAEANKIKMALHPDDPPISPIHGISRILTSAEAIDRALSLSDSSSHGLTFCQGTFTTMNEDVLQMIHKHGKNNKIFFVHIRDVIGSPENFRETFHDNGPTDMLKMMKGYYDVGFQGAIRSDHVPTMAGESNENFGYEMKGNLFGIGYMKGLMEVCRTS
ncbi:mannonate dehydratase [Flavobacterium fryxellicola]|uniref:mannonate dehydratase n=1 Tax=Flavobacterium fryxellicola TaxID=249352 RepID=A0A167U7S3_9FLAO|nr:mannonate dehydratase [Flavobacterium fryxellicola]OAB25339.1 mannonate dehydratase [Flavobacterium fryxellicola]SHN75033.1 mannonate dehydratase [Flavobacterium fryxellicola]